MSSASGPGRVKPVTVRDFIARKANGEKLVVVTAYDALFGRLVDESGVDAALVGDSLGNVVAGLSSTIPVTLDQMIYHARMVRRGVERALLIMDMPFLSYQVSVEDALRNCGRAMQDTEAQALKLEGATQEVLAAVRAATSVGIPVMGHLGFTPQSVHALGGFRVQGREKEAAERLVDDARKLEDAGAFSIVLELMPAAVASRITEAVSIPTIGIGAGAGCDGQVLVLPDLLGLNDRFTPKFLKHYASLANEVRSAVGRFGEDVRNGRYPDDEHSF
ncbi:MAG TPA: 3-methyl-2-oxobutanoate hydroxymethyltransferase [Gemmatimonadaceae bacterium]|jgi:3-methyl-2-oxobutanoate hydroxymethyltransferase|nr:3-methyl-2-oxobutanoate hydroxymethyltransferase [Gemmatimonadaceae bacterium]